MDREERARGEVGQVAISRGGRGRRTKGGSILGAKARSYENPSKFSAATVTSDCKLGFKQVLAVLEVRSLTCLRAELNVSTELVLLQAPSRMPSFVFRVLEVLHSSTRGPFLLCLASHLLFWL